MSKCLCFNITSLKINLGIKCQLLHCQALKNYAEITYIWTLLCTVSPTQVLTVMYVYTYCYVHSVLCILPHCVVLCTVCV
jgi:hypothetical protein